MTETARLFALLGSVNALLAVLLGAFGAHGLKDKLSEDLIAVYQTGVQYHVYHALGLLAVAWAANLLPDSALARLAGWSMLIGIGLFSGSLYVLAVTGIRWLGAITPFGGLSFLLGWVFLALALWRQ